MQPGLKPHSEPASLAASGLTVVIQKQRCISSTASAIGLKR